jgi:hypothetical protein
MDDTDKKEMNSGASAAQIDRMVDKTDFLAKLE